MNEHRELDRKGITLTVNSSCCLRYYANVILFSKNSVGQIPSGKGAQRLLVSILIAWEWPQEGSDVRSLCDKALPLPYTALSLKG